MLNPVLNMLNEWKLEVFLTVVSEVLACAGVAYKEKFTTTNLS